MQINIFFFFDSVTMKMIEENIYYKEQHMEKYLKDFIYYMEQLSMHWEELSYKKKKRQEICQMILTKIAFFQHERLIHLIVTVTFAVLFLLSLILCFICQTIFTLVLPILFLILLIPYIPHYYILENGVQKLYHLYDHLIS